MIVLGKLSACTSIQNALNESKVIVKIFKYYKDFYFNPYAALGTFLVFCSLISLTILAVLMQMV